MIDPKILTARIAQLEAERDEDTRAMARFQAASGQGIAELAAAGWALVERFADRIAELDQPDTKGDTT